MKTDKELLELAAKAAGYKVSNRLTDGGLMVMRDSRPHPHKWSPFFNGSDAIRLAVKLFIDISMDCDNRTVQASYRIDADNFRWTEEDLPDDELLAELAVFRAIVRAAAAIGEKL